ncbi:MAG: FadR/GntR family transcriptional regulator [Candidatus Methylomirabilales bacterium]|nr:FadR/GntR family transcriptional regulator [candidate division NC10 bacterium]
MLRVIKKTRVYEDIVTQLKELIAEGKVKPGDQLPSERELSERFQVSRASVREAIRSLESMGWIQTRQGEGTYIASSVETLLASIAFTIQHQSNPLLQVFEARKILEPAIAALAAERATAEEVGGLEAILNEQAQQVTEGETGVEADTRFHSTLADAAKNEVLLRLNDAIIDRLHETRERSLQTEGRPARSLAGHQEILRAIQSKDPAKAREAMLNHLETIEHNVLKSPYDSLSKEEDSA